MVTKRTTTNKSLTKQVDILGEVQLIAATCGLSEPKDGKLVVEVWLEQTRTLNGNHVYEHKYSIKKGGK